MDYRIIEFAIASLSIVIKVKLLRISFVKVQVMKTRIVIMKEDLYLKLKLLQIKMAVK